MLVIAYAWPRGADAPTQRRLVRLGLVLSLAGDVALLWPKEGFLPGLVAFLLAHLAYIAAFCVPLRLATRPVVFVVYGIVAVLILMPLWPGIPAPLRAPVVAYVVCLATMAAQAGALVAQQRRSRRARRPARAPRRTRRPAVHGLGQPARDQQVRHAAAAGGAVDPGDLLGGAVVHRVGAARTPDAQSTVRREAWSTDTAR